MIADWQLQIFDRTIANRQSCIPLVRDVRGPGVDPELTTLRVRNDNWHDVRIYLVRESGGPPIRVGTFGSLSSAVVQLKGSAIQEVLASGEARFLSRPLASRASFATYAVPVNLGDVIGLRVANNLTFSTLVVGMP